MGKKFDRDQLLDALDRVGLAAVANRETMEIAVYGGSALMLASNFRYASEDVDIAELRKPWPQWLDHVVSEIAAENEWEQDWLNEAVTVHLSPLATTEDDHVAFGTFPRNHDVSGLKVYVPTAEYMLALKLKAIRITDPAKGKQEAADILNLVRLLNLESPQEALAALAKFFPRSAMDVEKHTFLLKYIWNMEADDAPSYAGRGS
jgi:predicted nucleotidyltransferase